MGKICHCIPSCSLNLCPMPSKTYHSVAGNVTYKAIPSLLLPHPPSGSFVSLPPTLSRPSCWFKRCVLWVEIAFSWSQVRHRHGSQKLHLSAFRDSSLPCCIQPKKVLLWMVLIFCTRQNLAWYNFCTGNFGSFSFHFFFKKIVIRFSGNNQNTTVPIL